MLMAEDVRDISGQENLLDELNEMTINGSNVDQKLLRTNPVFDAERPSSKVSFSFLCCFLVHLPIFLLFCSSIPF